jgi:hypothetical protein
MKKGIIAIWLILSVFVIQAKEKDTKSGDTDATATVALKGNVADEISGEALVGVEIKLEGTDLKAYTDFDGNFTFDKIKQGEYKVIANYISYEKKTETMKVSPNTNELKIMLHSSN